MHDWCALPPPCGLFGCRARISLLHRLHCTCRLTVELLPHCAAHRHLHTSKRHTQEYRLSMCCCWDTLGHAVISASDQKKPVSPMQRCRLLRVRGMTAHRSLHALWLTAVQAPCCASLRQGSLHAAMAATRTVSEATDVRVAEQETSWSMEKVIECPPKRLHM